MRNREIYRDNPARDGGVIFFFDPLVLSLLNDAAECGAKEFIEWRREHSSELVVVIFVHDDLDAFEEDLVELAANMLWGTPVGTGALLSQIDRHLNEASGITKVRRKVFEFAIDSSEFGVETLLLGAEHLDRNRVVVVCLEKFALPTFDLELL